MALAVVGSLLQYRYRKYGELTYGYGGPEEEEGEVGGHEAGGE